MDYREKTNSGGKRSFCPTVALSATLQVNLLLLFLPNFKNWNLDLFNALQVAFQKPSCLKNHKFSWCWTSKLISTSKSQSRVDFIKVWQKAQIVDIALSICALRLGRTISPVKSSSKVRHCALRRPQLNEIDPWKNFLRSRGSKKALKYQNCPYRIKYCYKYFSLCVLSFFNWIIYWCIRMSL